MRLGSQPTVEAQLVLRGEGKARGCLIPIQVVGLHPVKTLGAAQIESRLKDRSEHLHLADVKPPLAGPAGLAVWPLGAVAEARANELPGAEAAGAAGVHAASAAAATMNAAPAARGAARRLPNACRAIQARM